MRTIQLEGGLILGVGGVADGRRGILIVGRVTASNEEVRAMDIAVAVRLMPKVGDELEVDGSGTDIDRELVDMVINEFDDQALEEAVLIKEATGAVTYAPWDSAPRGSSRRFARPMPVERTAWSSWRRARSTRTTRVRRRSRSRRRFASSLRISSSRAFRLRPTCGQTAPYLSAMLGWPQASVVVGVTLDDGRARVVQERGWAARGARSPAAGGRRRAVGQLAALRGNGAAAPGDDRGRAAGGDRQRRGVGSQVQARIPGAARAAIARDDARGRC